MFVTQLEFTTHYPLLVNLSRLEVNRLDQETNQRNAKETKVAIKEKNKCQVYLTFMLYVGRFLRI